MSNNSKKKIFVQKRPPENDGPPLTVFVMMFLLYLSNKHAHCPSHTLRIFPMLYIFTGHFLWVFGENIDVINHERIRLAPGSWRIQRASVNTLQNQSWSSICHKHWTYTASPGDRIVFTLSEKKKKLYPEGNKQLVTEAENSKWQVCTLFQVNSHLSLYKIQVVPKQLYSNEQEKNAKWVKITYQLTIHWLQINTIQKLVMSKSMFSLRATCAS